MELTQISNALLEGMATVIKNLIEEEINNRLSADSTNIQTLSETLIKTVNELSAFKGKVLEFKDKLKRRHKAIPDDVLGKYVSFFEIPDNMGNFENPAE